MKILIGIMAATFVAGGAVAQLRPPGDRADGEEEQIRARSEWFIQQRGIDRMPRADLVRRDAVLEVKRRRDTEAGDWDLRWTPEGPESMTMLNWSMGEVSGRVSALAVNPTNENVIYLGSASGGLWKTIDGGSSWQPIFDDVGTQTIGALYIDPAAPDTLWVGTGEQGQNCWSYFGMGLFRSIDGGETFEAMNGSGAETLDLSYITGIVIDPSNPDIVVVSGESWCDDGSWLYGGLYRTTDGGASWQRLINNAVTDLVMTPESPNVLFAAVGRWSGDGSGIYRSNDKGATWTRLENGLPYGSEVGRSRLAVSPSDSQTVYALMNEAGGVGLYRSIDGGNSWTLQNPQACDGQCSYNLCLAVHPSDPAHLLVGAIRFYLSLDGGVNLFPLTDYWGSGQEVHQDTHVLVFSRSNPDRFWVAGDGGIWRSDTGGLSFVNLNANLNLTQFYDIEVHPQDRATIFGGAQDNSSSATTGDVLWDVTVVTGDGFISVVDPEDPNIVLQTSYPWDGLPSLYLSTTGGSPNSFSWIWLQGVTQYEPWPWVTPLAEVDLSGVPGSPLFMGSDRVYRSSTLDPTQWEKISNDLTGPSGSLSVISPVANGDSVTVYVGTSNGRIHRSENAAAPVPIWTDVTGNYPGATVTDIAVDPTDVAMVFVTRGEFNLGQLFRSSTGGTTWEIVGAGLPNVPANSVVVDPKDSERVFVATDVGVMMSLDRGATFVPLMAGLPLGVVVTDLEVDDDPHVLTAGTYGRGAWQLELSPPVLFADGFETGDLSTWSAAVN